MKCCLAFLLLQILVHSANETLHNRGHCFLQFLPRYQFCCCFQKRIHNKHNFLTPTMDNFMPNHTHLFIAAHTMCDTTFLHQANDTHRTTRTQICSEWCFACSCYAKLSQCTTGQFKYLLPIYYMSQRIEIQWLNSYQGSWYYCGEKCQQVTQTYNHYKILHNTNM
jgi:hypothetical protein